MNRLVIVIAALLCVGACTAAAQTSQPTVKLGVDVLIRDNFKPLIGKKIGLITNATGVTSELSSTIDVLRGAPGVRLVALFGPEHGVRGDAPAGESVADAKDSATGLPVYSLYGKTQKPTPEMLAGLDALVFDMQDIGARSYTYISTMARAMEAAAENNIEFIVLDRPNPIGGNRVEGRVLDLKFRSGVGPLPIPYCHGMTVGELAQMINGEGWLGELQPSRKRDVGPERNKTAGKPLRCKLTVVEMNGWHRNMIWSDTGLPWTPTSPHIPREDSAFFYSATGIIGELDAISVGVGYTLPFELVGCPDLNAEQLAANLNSRRLAGVHFRPTYFQPFYSRFEKKTCGGVQILLTDPKAAELTAIGFHVLDAVHKQQPRIRFFDGDRNAMFDKVCGTDVMRKMLQEDRPIDDVLKFWRETTDEFREKRKPYLLY